MRTSAHVTVRPRLASVNFTLHTNIAMSQPPSPMRILVVVKRQKSEQAWREAWDDPGKLITRALRHLKHDELVSPEDEYNGPNCRFMAVSRWDPLTFLAFDLFHTGYNALEAHLEGRDELPITPIHLRRANKLKSYPPQPIGHVNGVIRRAHDMHGWDARPPYRIDHANGVHPTYLHARRYNPPPEHAQP